MTTIEYTDTFGGEANYSWARRYFTRRTLTDTQAVRLAKSLVGLTGTRCTRESFGDCITLRPAGHCTVLFIDWYQDDAPDCSRPVGRIERFDPDALTDRELRAAGLHPSQV